MKNRYARLIFTLFFLLGTTAGFAESRAPEIDLDQLLEVALANNSELKAAEYRWQLYEHKVPQAGVLSDPFLSFGLSNYPVDSWTANETAMSGKILKLTQDFPFPGKLSAQKEKSQQQALWYREVYEDGKLQLAWRVKDAFYALAFSEQALKITRKNIALLDDFIRLTETNYEIGKGLQQDVLKAQVERSKLIDRTYLYTKQLERAVADLRNLTNQELTAPLAELPVVEPTRLNTPIEELLQSFENARPIFSAYRALIEQNKLQKKLAGLDYKPNFKLGVSYTFREPNLADDGTDFAGVEFGLNIPIFIDKRKAAVFEAEAAVNMAEQQLANQRNSVQLNIRDAFLRIRQSQQQVELYKNGLIPQAAQTFEASLSGYQVGKVDFLALLDSQRTVYDYELEYNRVLTDGQRALARLQAETGLPNL